MSDNRITVIDQDVSSSASVTASAEQVKAAIGDGGLDLLLNVAGVANIAVGVNWYLNPWVRLMFNYVMSTTDERTSGAIILNDADVNSFLMRWDIHF